MYTKYIYLQTYIICIYYTAVPIYIYIKEGERGEESDEMLITWGERQ